MFFIAFKVISNMALSTRSVFEFFSPVCIKALKWLKYDNIPYRTKAVLLAYNVWHHCIRKPLFSSVHTKREFGVFKSPLWGQLSGDLFFWCPKRPLKIPCGRSLKFLQPNATALRVCCRWIDPLWAKHQLCTSITLICILLRLSKLLFFHSNHLFPSVLHV